MANIKQGTYIISSALGNNQVLDISGARLTNGGNAQIYASNGTAAQNGMSVLQEAVITHYRMLIRACI